MKRLIATAMTAAYVFGAAVGSGIANERVASAELLRTLVTVPLPGEPTNLALADGSLWMSVPAEAILLRIDARSGRRLARIRVTDQDRRAFGGGAVAAWRGIIWVAAPVHVDDDPSLPPKNSGWIGRLDTRTGQMRIAFVNGDPPVAIAAGPAGVWVSGGKTLRRIDPRSGRSVASASLLHRLGDVAVGANRVWVAAPGAGMVLGVDPRRRRVVNKIVTGPTSSNGSLALERLLWAATDSGVVAVDPRRSRVVARVPVPRAQGIAVDNSAVWIYAPRGLYSVDAGIATRRFAPPAPAFGAVAARQGRIWISDSVTRTLWRVGP